MKPLYNNSSIVLIGPPGAGKSTQGRLLQEHDDRFWRISTGELYQKRKTDKHIRRIVNKYRTSDSEADFFSDKLAQELVKFEMGKGYITPETVFVLDGFPRTQDQVPLLEQLVSIDEVIDLHTDDGEELLRRLGARGERAYDSDEIGNMDRIMEYACRTRPAARKLKQVARRYDAIDPVALDAQQVHALVQDYLMQNPAFDTKN